jgi:uncharacterized protein
MFLGVRENQDFDKTDNVVGGETPHSGVASDTTSSLVVFIAYFLFTVQIFDSSAARRDSNPKRIYCIDHAMVASVASGILVNSGHLLENLVFTALRRLYPDIYYYKTKTGREVDFIVPTSGKTQILIQACESLADTQTRKRELTALCEAMAEIGIKTGIIVTRSRAEQIKTDAGIIDVIPAWRFLLDLPESPT